MLRSMLVVALLWSAALLAPARAPGHDDISGKWHFVHQTEGGERENDAVFKLEHDQVTGTYANADVKGVFKDGELDLAFPFNSEEAGMTATLKLKGKLENGKLRGNWQFGDHDGSFVASRVE